MQQPDIPRLKKEKSFEEVLRKDGHRINRTGGKLACCCPFHDDSTPSFTIYPDQHAHCLGCGWHGDVIDYIQKRDGSDFPTALASLDTFRTQDDRTSVAKIEQHEVARNIISLDPEFLNKVDQYCSRLAEDDWLAGRVVRDRRWNKETILQLAQDRDLGWAGDALAFIYPMGVKLRQWPGREFRWEMGSTGLWRSRLLLDAAEVFLTEGETDAISLLDAGMEAEKGKIVVATQGAQSFLPQWAQRFHSKIVTICFDSDPPGRKAAKDVAAILRPFAAAVYDFNPAFIQ